MRVIDLSHVIEESMPVFPGDASPRLLTNATVDEQGYYERTLTMSSHTGTHIDAPAHMFSHMDTLDKYPADKFVGPAVVIDIDQFAGQRIPLDYLLAQDFSGAEFVLLQSGWEHYWGQEAYFRGYPLLSLQAAQWLAGLGLKGLGVDMISVDPTYPPEAEIHHALLGSGMILVENLRGLGEISREAFTFCALPLKLKNADGSPVRATAILH